MSKSHFKLSGGDKKSKREERQYLRDSWILVLTERDMVHCIRCEYDTCFSALEYHHLDPKKKKYNIADIMKMAITEERLKELDKVICLCANCHRELAAGMWEYSDEPGANILLYMDRKDYMIRNLHATIEKKEADIRELKKCVKS